MKIIKKLVIGLFLLTYIAQGYAATNLDLPKRKIDFEIRYLICFQEIPNLIWTCLL